MNNLQKHFDDHNKRFAKIGVTIDVEKFLTDQSSQNPCPLPLSHHSKLHDRLSYKMFLLSLQEAISIFLEEAKSFSPELSNEHRESIERRLTWISDQFFQFQNSPCPKDKVSEEKLETRIKSMIKELLLDAVNDVNYTL